MYQSIEIESTPEVKSLSAAFAVVLAVFMASCSEMYQRAEVEVDIEERILHLDYRSGGDVPGGFLITFLSDGAVRLHSPHRKTAWSRLSAEDFSVLTELIQSNAFSSAIDALKAASSSFACCDYNELAIYLNSADEPLVIIFGSELSRLAAVVRFTELVNRIGDTYFRAHYRLSLPSPEGVEALPPPPPSSY